MAGQAKAAMGADTLDVLADRGYFSGEEVLACEPVESCVDAPVDARDLLTAPAMIGCGHVSGLEVRLCHMPRAGMEIRRAGADQKRER
jgi:indole-3-glycerol phosphate synthase